MAAQRFVLATTIALAAGCGEAPGYVEVDCSSARQQPIIEGEEARRGEYPAVGAFLVSGTESGTRVGSFYCSGTLIDYDLVLTAAHCLNKTIGDGPVSETWFSLANDVSGYDGTTASLPKVTSRVAAMVQHPDWDPDALDQPGAPTIGQYYDIGLAFLQTPLGGVDTEVILRLEDERFIDPLSRVEVVGYGQRTGGSTTGAAAGVKYQGTSVIQELGDFEMKIGDTSGTARKCFGDSGGPTYRVFNDGRLPQRRIIGVSSHTSDGDACADGGVDTRIEPYREWLSLSAEAACTIGIRSFCIDGGALRWPERRCIDNVPTGQVDACSGLGSETTAAVGSVLSLLLVRRLRRRRQRR